MTGAWVYRRAEEPSQQGRLLLPFHILIHSLARQTVLESVAADTAGAVAAHLAHGAVGVEKQHPAVAAVVKGNAMRFSPHGI